MFYMAANAPEIIFRGCRTIRRMPIVAPSFFAGRARLLSAAAAVHFVAAWFSAGHFNFDEHTNIINFAAFYLGMDGGDELTYYKLRSMFMPAVVVAAVKILSATGIDSPFAWAFSLRVLSTVLALSATAVFCRAFAGEIKGEAVRRYIFAAMLFLYPLVFYHVRFSAEGWMSSFLLLALAAHRVAGENDLRESSARGFALRIVAGAFLGLMFLSRYQGALIVAPLFLWAVCINRESPRQIAGYAAGFAAAFGFGTVLDFRLYDAPVLPWLEYARFHFAENFPGAPRPWYAYFTRIFVMLPPASLFAPLIVAVFYWKFPRHIFTWATAAFVVFHLLVANKQTRFLYPLLPFLPFMCAALWEASPPPPLSRARRWIPRVLRVSAAVNIPPLLFVMFFPASKEVALLQNCIIPRIAGEKAAVYVADKSDFAVLELNLGFYGAEDADFFPLRPAADFAPPENYDIVLFASRRAKIAPPPDADARLVCRALPEWILAFNINDWTRRASVWRVWEIPPRGEKQK
ncbi:MAG: hypothetical protein ACR2QC_00095 [Gammaproteobacteria bacterium]